MNLLFLSLLYHPQEIESVARLSRNGLFNQVNVYQWAILEGLHKNLSPEEKITVLNSLPVGICPKNYRQLVLRSKKYDEDFHQIGSLNLPGFKQVERAVQARREMERWVEASPENRTILIYTLYLPYLHAVEAVKKKHPDLKAVVIVTDLPNELGIDSGRRGLLQKIEFHLGRNSMSLCAKMDGFVLLTAPMADALKVQSKPWIVVEGLISEEMPAVVDSPSIPNDDRPVVLYTGTINRDMDIEILLEAFRELNEVQLWICGRGNMQREITTAAQKHPNIRYFGFVPRETALALQAKAALLINPRTPQGVYTRYSFPSKTLEYMRSGKPVLCCRLEGIPDEYEPYLTYIEPPNAQGIRETVLRTLALTAEQLAKKGSEAKAFALQYKNSRAQCERIVELLRKIAK